MEKKNIVIWMYPSQKIKFSKKYHKGLTYIKFIEELSRKNNVYFALDFASYKKGDYFFPVYIYTSKGFRKFNFKIKADVIYYYSNLAPVNFKTYKIKISNSQKFKNFCRSKIKTYNYLKEFSPKTFYVSNRKDFFKFVKRIKSRKIVLKPDTGRNGKDIFFIDSNKIKLTSKLEKLFLKGVVIQEFLDTSKGIAGICKSTHDLRIITINNKIVLTHVRIPEKGSLIANAHRGAKIKELKKEEIPKKILTFYKKVHKKILRKFPYPMYSMDIAYTDKGPRLIEINGHTAFPKPYFKSRGFFIKNLVRHLEKLI